MVSQTVDDVDKLMREVFIDCSGEDMPRDLWDSTSFRMSIQNTLYGLGITTLRSDQKVITIDDPNQTGPGIKAVSLTASAVAELEVELNTLKSDPVLIASLKGLDVNMQMRLIHDAIIGRIVDKQTRVRLSVIDPLNPNILALINAGSGEALEQVAPTGIEGLMKKVENRFAKWISTKTKSVKTVPDITTAILQTAGTAIQMGFYQQLYRAETELFGKLPVILGPCPLKHCDYIEVARSGKVLKFRATGSVFLAKQEGGADAIKIEGKLYKSEFGFMFLLWALFLYGQSKIRDMAFLNTIKVDNVADVRKINDLLMTDSSLQKPSYEYHRVFPFVNRHFIIPNCYIETISIEDKLPLKDTIRYSVLLRTYTKPRKLVKYVVDEKAGTSIYGIQKKSFSSEMIELSLNIMWRLMNAEGWLIDNQEWKIGSAKDEGVTDTYYDLDASSLATVVYLSLMGAVV